MLLIGISEKNFRVLLQMFTFVIMKNIFYKIIGLKQYVKNKLKELNKITEEINLTLLGDYRISKGKLIDINISEYELSHIYLITSAEHTISSNTEKVRISIKKYNKK